MKASADRQLAVSQQAGGSSGCYWARCAVSAARTVCTGSAPSDRVHSDLQDAACVKRPAARAPRLRSSACDRTLSALAGPRLWLPVSCAGSAFVLCVLRSRSRLGCTGLPTVWNQRGPCRLRRNVVMPIFRRDRTCCEAT